MGLLFTVALDVACTAWVTLYSAYKTYHSSGGGFSRPVFAKTDKEESSSATIASIILYLAIMFVTYWFLQLLCLHASPSFVFENLT